MHGESIFFTIFLIFTGAAIVAGLALFTRQSMLVAYIALGGIVGPWGLGLIEDATAAQEIGEVGIIFLLYLLGLNLHPQKLSRMLREAMVVTAASSLAFAGAGIAVALAFGFTVGEALVIGALSMFSSTILGLKLLPTTALHHRHTGEIIISVLLIQDVIAIVILLGLDAASRPSLSVADTLLVAVALPAIVVVSAAMERWILLPPHPPVRHDPRVRLSRRDRLVPRHLPARLCDGAVARDRGVRRRRGPRAEPGRDVHRGIPQAAARLLPGDVLLRARGGVPGPGAGGGRPPRRRVSAD